VAFGVHVHFVVGRARIDDNNNGWLEGVRRYVSATVFSLQRVDDNDELDDETADGRVSRAVERAGYSRAKFRSIDGTIMAAIYG